MQPVASTPAAYLKGKTMREYAIVTAGGKIDDDFALRILSENKAAFLVAADRGLVFLDRHGIVPDLVVGDFDSAGEEYVRQYLQTHPEVRVKSFHWEKDDTDTEIAAKEAVEMGCTRIDFLGATGSRFDHVLGNVQVLHMLLEQGVTGRILELTDPKYAGLVALPDPKIGAMGKIRILLRVGWKRGRTDPEGISFSDGGWMPEAVQGDCGVEPD